MAMPPKPPPLPPGARAKGPRPPPMPRAARPQFGGANLRVHKRVDIAVAADVRYHDELFAARTRDLSEGGVGLELGVEVPRGEKVWVSLFLVEDEIEAEDSEPFTILGEVMWRSVVKAGEVFAVGVKFADMDPEEKKDLQDFLQGR